MHEVLHYWKHGLQSSLLSTSSTYSFFFFPLVTYEIITQDFSQYWKHVSHFTMTSSINSLFLFFFNCCPWSPLMSDYQMYKYLSSCKTLSPFNCQFIHLFNLPEIIVTFIYHTSPFITSSALLTHLTSISTTCWILNSTLAFLKSPLPWMSPLQLIQVCTEHYNFHNCHLTNLKFPSLTILPPWPLPAVTLPTVAISPC